jgi:hypothetical protein
MSKYIYRGDDYINTDTDEAYIVTNIVKLGNAKEVVIELTSYDRTNIIRCFNTKLANTFREANKCVVNGVTILT